MKATQIEGAKTSNETLIRWIKDTAELCQPDRVHICDGSQAEYDRLCNEMVQSGTFIRLNEEKRPNSFLCRYGPFRCTADHTQPGSRRRCKSDPAGKARPCLESIG